MVGLEGPICLMYNFEKWPLSLWKLPCPLVILRNICVACQFEFYSPVTSIGPRLQIVYKIQRQACISMSALKPILHLALCVLGGVGADNAYRFTLHTLETDV